MSENFTNTSAASMSVSARPNATVDTPALLPVASDENGVAVFMAIVFLGLLVCGSFMLNRRKQLYHVQSQRYSRLVSVTTDD